MSAWIEIRQEDKWGVQRHIALLVSAWIEIISSIVYSTTLLIALLVSAWIEIVHLIRLVDRPQHRTPCECVD